MAKTKDVLLDHEIDGIQEYDNALPAWWLGILYFTIAFAVFFVPYLYITGWTSVGQLDEEMAAAAERYGDPAAAVADSADVEFVPTAEDVVAGQEVWKANCVACHLEDGTGSIGPDLTDAEWIHGGALEDIRATVFNGVPEKGMLTWGPVIGQTKVNQVSAYVHGLGGGQ